MVKTGGFNDRVKRNLDLGSAISHMVTIRVYQADRGSYATCLAFADIQDDEPVARRPQAAGVGNAIQRWRGGSLVESPIGERIIAEHSASIICSSSWNWADGQQQGCLKTLLRGTDTAFMMGLWMVCLVVWFCLAGGF